MISRDVFPGQALVFANDTLAIVGSTEFVDPGGMAEARAIIEATLDFRRPDRIVSGGARGVDTLAATVARERGIPCREHPARRRQWNGPGGFKERNLWVVGDCTRLLAIRCHASKTFGSGWTAMQARKQGRAVCVVTL